MPGADLNASGTASSGHRLFRQEPVLAKHPTYLHARRCRWLFLHLSPRPLALGHRLALERAGAARRWIDALGYI